MPRQLSETDRAVLAALCRQYIQGRRVPSPATPDEILAELRAEGVALDVDALRARLRRLCAEYGVEEDRPDVMRAELVKRLGDDGSIESWSQAGAGSDRNPFERLQEPTRGLLERLQGRGMVVGLSVIVAVVVVAIVVFWPNGFLGRGSSPERYVIDPAEMNNARGSVTYCIGGDVTGQQHAAVADFNKRFRSSDLTIKLVDLGEDADQALERFSSFQRGGKNRCDVLDSDVIWTANLVHNKWLLDLSRYLRYRTERLHDAFVPTMLRAATVDGRAWGIPKAADAGLLFYRTDHVNDVPTTWQELYRQAAAGSKPRFRYQGLAYEGLTVDFLEIAFAAGAGAIITPAGKANINQAPAREALQFMVDGIGHAAPYGVVLQKESAGARAFAKGRAYFMRNWPSYEKLLDANPRLAGKVGVTRLPSWSGGGQGSVLGGHLLVISRLSKNRGAALKAVDFLSSRAIVRREAIRFSIAPALSKLWSDPAVQQALPSYLDLKDGIYNATLRPRVANYQAVSKAISTNVNRALRGDAEPAAALALANDQMNQALEAEPAP